MPEYKLEKPVLLNVLYTTLAVLITYFFLRNLLNIYDYVIIGIGCFISGNLTEYLTWYRQMDKILRLLKKKFPGSSDIYLASSVKCETTIMEIKYNLQLAVYLSGKMRTIYMNLKTKDVHEV